jgi:hypothetical protein
VEAPVRQVGFAVGTGRCGTRFLDEVLTRDPLIASHHERHAFSDTFHRYCRWYNIPVDETGFIAVKRRAIEQDLRSHAYSFEASAFLSLSLQTLQAALGAQLVMMVRRPDRVVSSYLRKGWYANEPLLEDASKPPTMQDVEMPHHFLGRTMPIGAEFERWRGLTRVGKIAWFWARLNKEMLAQAARLPAGTTRLQKLEELDYASFRELVAFLGAPANVTEMEFATVRGQRPNASYGQRAVHAWSELERTEFEADVREMAEHFGYMWRAEELALEPAPPRRAPSLRSLAGPLLHGLLGPRRARV